MPLATPLGNSAQTEERLSAKRIPRKGNPTWSGMSIPSALSSETLSGMRPSPQGLLMGGRAQSMTVTAQPIRLSAIAAAKPAGPPPTMHTLRWKLNIDDSSGQAKRFTPEHRGRVGQLYDLVNRFECFVDLVFADD